MHFLLTNDDGFLAEGLKALKSQLSSLGKVTTIAPYYDRSGASSSISLQTPLIVEEFAEDDFAVRGSPADCMIAGLSSDLIDKPDWVVSGINHGANLAEDTVYSGTVGAAIEGHFYGCKTMAISLVGKDLKYFNTAARIASELIQNKKIAELATQAVLNLNVPSLPYDKIKGVRAAHLGLRKYHPKMEERFDPRGRKYYWIGPPSSQIKDGDSANCDLTVVKEGFATLTALRPSYFAKDLHETLESIL